MYYLYILYSDSLQEYYCGQCNDMDSRLRRHNLGETRSIKHGIPWKIIGFVIFETRAEAMALEKQIKKRGIKRWLDAHGGKLVQPG